MRALKPFSRRLLAVCACGALSLAAELPLRAAEQVTLTNGFALLCDHQEQVGGKVRLYTDSGNDNFLEVDPGEIASVETLPDPPRPPAPAPAVVVVEAPAVLTKAELAELISKAGAQHNLDTDLLASVVKAESGGNVRAVSPKGAEGLMQLMPVTAAQLGVADSFRPDQNINGGTAYLDALLTRYHENLALALAAYNAGPEAVDKYHGIPPYAETRAYVARVIREFNRRKEAEMHGRSAVAGSGASQAAY
jgi:soluble lytic murein transglycosylase-like protein